MFNLGDPVKSVLTPHVLGKVVEILEPTGEPDAFTGILIKLAGKKHTASFYYEDELKLCRCGTRILGRIEPCVKNILF